ncbi:MAG: hypothetical protein MI755_21185 [Sphingomonadales bacterium]|nr:hypothetical protein [Sphingomonadales bacterium]
MPDYELEELRDTTAQGREKLKLARELAERAQKLAEGDDQRVLLESEAERLLTEASEIMDRTRSKLYKYSK